MIAVNVGDAEHLNFDVFIRMLTWKAKDSLNGTAYWCDTLCMQHLIDEA